ncbi:MAG TPA: xanthine dehydrogenase family protein subunit M [Polyangia bacterium]
MLPRFEYLAPDTVDEAVALLARLGGAARVMAGGTDLLMKLTHGQLAPATVVSLTRIPALRPIEYAPATGLTIGATARLAEVLEHPAVVRHFPALAEAAAQTATVQIRNMGTVVGNLCNASPCADNAPTLIARGARIEVRSAAGSRWVDLEAFFVGPGATVLRPDELVVSVQVPPPPPRTGVAYQCLSERSHVDVSAVSVAALVTRDGPRCRAARIVLGAVGPTPLRAARAEELLAGQELSEALLREAGAAAAAAARPLSDVRASADYRRRMVAVLTRRALATAAARAAAREVLA